MESYYFREIESNNPLRTFPDETETKFENNYYNSSNLKNNSTNSYNTAIDSLYYSRDLLDNYYRELYLKHKYYQELYHENNFKNYNQENNNDSNETNIDPDTNYDIVKVVSGHYNNVLKEFNIGQPKNSVKEESLVKKVTTPKKIEKNINNKKNFNNVLNHLVPSIPNFEKDKKVFKFKGLNRQENAYYKAKNTYFLVLKKKTKGNTGTKITSETKFYAFGVASKLYERLMKDNINLDGLL